MLIEEMTDQESVDLLTRTRLGRLACAHGSQPYVVPFYYAYHDYYLYAFTTVGQKIEWMRENPLVCVQVDEIVSSEEWLSVIVYGRYEELPDTPECHFQREFAWKLLQRYGMWWQPALAKTTYPGVQLPRIPVFYRISADRVTGHRATVDPKERVARTSREVPKKRGWLHWLHR